VPGLDLHPRRTAPAGVVGRRRVLDHHALVTPGQHVREERVHRGGVRGDEARDDGVARHHRVQRPEPFRRGGVDEVAAVEVEDVEEVRGERHALAQGCRVPAHRPRPGLLEGAGAAVRPECDRLAVEDDGAHVQGADRLHHLGHPVGDVVERAREDDDVVARPVRLDADPVDLAVDGDLAGHPRQGGVDVRG